MELTFIIDADDTLWETERYYQECIAAFGDLMAELALDRQEALHMVERVESERVPVHGYGPEAFARSLVIAYQRLCRCHGRIADDAVCDAVYALADTVAQPPIVLLEGVAETLPRLQEHARLILLTKGDEQVQRDKLARSGLEHLFHAVHVVPEKDAVVFQNLIALYDLHPQRTWMVGNSPRSDINPALEAGMGAIHIPHTRTWSLEQADIVDPQRVSVLQSFKDLEPLLIQIREDRHDRLRG